MERSARSRPLALVIALVLVAACTKKPAPGSESSPQGPSGKDAPVGTPRAEFWRAAKDAIEHCGESSLPLIFDCKHKAHAELTRGLPRRMGWKAYALGACQNIFDRDPKIADMTLSVVHELREKRTPETASSELMSCLRAALKRARERPQVANAAGYLSRVGTYLRRDAEVLAAVKAHPSKFAREAGYYDSWLYAKLRVFPLLKKMVDDSKDSSTKLMALSSVGNAETHTAKELAVICPWFDSLIHDPDAHVGATAASTLLSCCQDLKNGRKVLRILRAMHDTKTFSAFMVSTLYSMGQDDFYKSQRADVLQLMQDVGANKGLDDGTRTDALSRLYNLDEALGLQLAKRHLKSPNGALRRWAKFMLEKSAR